MKKSTGNILKYVFSGFMVLVLTAGFMLLPEISNALLSPQKTGTVKDIKLVKTVETLTKKEKATFFYDTRNAALFTEIYGDRAMKEYTSECSAVLDDVFGTSSDLSKTIHNEYKTNLKNQNFAVRAFKYTAFYGGDVLSLNLVLAQYGSLVIWYEEESKLALSICLIDMGDLPYDALNEHEKFDDADCEPIGNYYTALGLQKEQFYYYPTGTGSSVTMVTAGIFSFAETESIEIEPMKPFVTSDANQ